MTPDRKCLVTLCIPSNRRLLQARASLDSAIDYAAMKGYRVVISDNSSEPAKEAHFATVPDHVTYVANPTLSPLENMLACVDLAETEFIMPLGDDDFLEAIEGETDFDFSAIGDDVIGVRPYLEVFAIGEGTLRTNNFTIDAEDSAARIQEYRAKINADNSLYYSFFRRRDFIDVARLLNDNHPTHAGDGDWSVVYSLVACGKIAYDSSTRLKYDVGKWRWNEGIKLAVDELYTSVDLPTQAVAFAQMLRFLDCYVLALRPTSRLPELERIKAVYAFAVIFLGDFLRQTEKRPAEFSGFESEIIGLRAALKTPDDDLFAIYDACAQITDRLRPGLYQAYLQWLLSSRSDNISE